LGIGEIAIKCGENLGQVTEKRNVKLNITAPVQEGTGRSFNI